MVIVRKIILQLLLIMQLYRIKQNSDS